MSYELIESIMQQLKAQSELTGFEVVDIPKDNIADREGLIYVRLRNSTLSDVRFGNSHVGEILYIEVVLFTREQIVRKWFNKMTEIVHALNGYIPVKNFKALRYEGTNFVGPKDGIIAGSAVFSTMNFTGW